MEEAESPLILEFRLPVRRISMILAWISLALAAASALVHFLRVNNIWRKFQMLGTFSLDREHSLPAYFSASLLLLVAVATFAVALIRRKRRVDSVLAWFGLSGIFLLLSIDEGVALHERIVRRLSRLLDARGLFTETEVIPGVLLAILFLIAYSRFFKGLDRRVRSPLLLGFVLYGLGAILVKMLGGLWSSAHGRDAVYFIGFVTFEETLEMLGIVLLFYSVLSHLTLELKSSSLRVGPVVDDIADPNPIDDGRASSELPVR